jgi:hypothetical protein
MMTWDMKLVSTDLEQEMVLVPRSRCSACFLFLSDESNVVVTPCRCSTERGKLIISNALGLSAPLPSST